MSAYGRGRPKHWAKHGTKLPPGTAGEYRIVNRETGKPVYIGESGDLQRRLNQHTRTSQKPSTTDKSQLYDPVKHEVRYQLAKPHTSPEDRRQHERASIAKHRPLWNRDRGGSGRK